MKAVVFELPRPEDLEEGRLDRILANLRRGLAHLPADRVRMVTSYRGRPGLMLRGSKEELAPACEQIRAHLDAERLEYVEHLYFEEPRSTTIPAQGLLPDGTQEPDPRRRRRELRRLVEGGKAFCRLELFDDARAQFQAAHQLDPHCGEALHGLGLVELREGRDDTAERLVRRAIASDPRKAAYQYTLGGLCHRTGRLEEAEKALRRAIALAPKDATYFDFLGWIYLDQGDTERASSAFQEALDLAPGLVTSLTGMGSVLFADGHLEESLRLLEHALSEDPGYLVAQLQLAWCRFHLGDLERAEHDFLQVLHGDAADLHGPAAFGLGRLYLQRGSLPLAIQHLARCDGEGWATARWTLGEALFLSGRYEEAEVELRRALELDPTLHEEVEPRLALCALRQGRLEEAEAWIAHALEHQGPQGSLLELLGAIHGSRGKWEEARRAVEQACRLEPDSAPAFFQLGWIDENLDQPEEARECYLRALRLDPQCLEASLNLGWLFMDEDRMGEAAVIFESALENHPEDAELHYSLGRVLYREGRFDKAVEMLHRALVRQPERADTRAWLGAALCSAGQAEEGRRELRQALRQGPDEETACFIRRQLRQRAPRPATVLSEGLVTRTRKRADRLPSAS